MARCSTSAFGGGVELGIGDLLLYCATSTQCLALEKTQPQPMPSLQSCKPKPVSSRASKLMAASTNRKVSYKLFQKSMEVHAPTTPQYDKAQVHQCAVGHFCQHDVLQRMFTYVYSHTEASQALDPTQSRPVGGSPPPGSPSKLYREAAAIRVGVLRASKCSLRRPAQGLLSGNVQLTEDGSFKAESLSCVLWRQEPLGCPPSPSCQLHVSFQHLVPTLRFTRNT